MQPCGAKHDCEAADSPRAAARRTVHRPREASVAERSYADLAQSQDPFSDCAREQRDAEQLLAAIGSLGLGMEGMEHAIDRQQSGRLSFRRTSA
jgi:hypothetical protein